MKTILFLMAFLSVNAFAWDPSRFYAGNFEIVDISPMCPKNIPAGAQCFGLGSIVRISTTTGCDDKLAFFDTEIVPTSNGVELHVASVFKRGSRKILCYVAPVVIKTIPVHHMGNIELINVELR